MAIAFTEVKHPDPAPDFATLAHTHRPALARYCRRLTTTSHDAEDLLQDTLAKAFGAFVSLEDPDRFLPWCRTIARRLRIDQSRRRRFVEEELTDEHADAPAEDVADRLATRSVLAAALVQLPERSRVVVAARSEGVSARAIAATLDLEPARVDTIYARARQRLRDLLVDADGVIGAAIGLFPIRARGWVRRRAERLAEWVRRAGNTGLAQVGALALALTVVGVGTAMLPSDTPQPIAHSWGVPDRYSTKDGVMQESTVPGSARTEGVTPTARLRTVPGYAAVPGYQPKHCLIVGECGAAAHVGPTDQTIAYVSIGFLHTWFRITNGSSPNALPRSPQDVQTLLVGDPNGLSCDARILTTGRTCHSLTPAEELARIVEFTRLGLFGDICDAYHAEGVDPPLICQPLLSAHPAGVSPTPALSSPQTRSS